MHIFKRDLTAAIQRSVDVAKVVHDYIKTLPCPGCGKPKLKLAGFLETKKTWEAQFVCTGCKATGTVNDTGLSLNLSGEPSE